MDKQNQRIVYDGADTDFFELLAKARSIVTEHKRWALLTPIACMLAGLILAKTTAPQPQWEASTHLLPDVGPVENLLEQATAATFRERVLKRCGIAPGTPEASLYLKTQKVRLLSEPRLIEVRARSYSRETAMKLVSTTAEELENLKIAMGPSDEAVYQQQLRLGLTRTRRTLSRTQKTLRDIESIIAKSKKHSTSAGDSSQLVLSIYLGWMLETNIEDLQYGAEKVQKQLDSGDKKSVFFSEVAAAELPISPRTYPWTICAGLFGTFLGIAIPLSLSFIQSIKKA
jgi:hypothetical protein